jgi:hypothetical protein
MKPLLALLLFVSLAALSVARDELREAAKVNSRISLSPGSVASRAYLYADAMMNARERNKEEVK